MKKDYETPKQEFIVLRPIDIITGSKGFTDNELPDEESPF